jgi:hypothetical protein
MKAEQQKAAGPDRFLLGIVAGIVVLVVASIVVVLTIGPSRAAQPADTATPVGVVQAYVEAVRAEDYTRAHSYLTQKTRTEVEERESKERYPYRPHIDDHVRILVGPAMVNGDTAEVPLTVSRFYARNEPFSTSTTHHDVTVRLVREYGEWRITQQPDASLY